ncbi:hypothetical protein KIPB_000003 [Kipferlia bialata]|uniref:N-alpha-acetyltransferase 40 n=1 Tax=Kipferlia bialata TaxID=797122 RepID=A0A9K3GE11_9EUKA|nr:hypothetical protein KIPB_000003 [Kipferlia bialata]|eukprot:g3.t1
MDTRGSGAGLDPGLDSILHPPADPAPKSAPKPPGVPSEQREGVVSSWSTGKILSPPTHAPVAAGLGVVPFSHSGRHIGHTHLPGMSPYDTPTSVTEAEGTSVPASEGASVPASEGASSVASPVVSGWYSETSTEAVTEWKTEGSSGVVTPLSVVDVPWQIVTPYYTATASGTAEVTNLRVPTPTPEALAKAREGFASTSTGAHPISASAPVPDTTAKSSPPPWLSKAMQEDSPVPDGKVTPSLETFLTCDPGEAAQEAVEQGPLPSDITMVSAGHDLSIVYGAGQGEAEREGDHPKPTATPPGKEHDSEVSDAAAEAVAEAEREREREREKTKAPAAPLTPPGLSVSPTFETKGEAEGEGETVPKTEDVAERVVPVPKAKGKAKSRAKTKRRVLGKGKRPPAPVRVEESPPAPPAKRTRPIRRVVQKMLEKREREAQAKRERERETLEREMSQEADVDDIVLEEEEEEEVKAIPIPRAKRPKKERGRAKTKKRSPAKRRPGMRGRSSLATTSASPYVSAPPSPYEPSDTETDYIEVSHGPAKCEAALLKEWPDHSEYVVVSRADMPRRLLKRCADLAEEHTGQCASVDDLPPTKRLSHHQNMFLFRVQESGLPRTDRHPSKAMHSDPAAFWDRVRGYIAFRFIDEYGFTRAYIIECHVRNEYRRQSHGSKMMDAMEVIVRDLGMDQVALTVHNDNKAGVHFYNRLGFVPAFENPDDDPTCTYTIMSKDVPVE